MVNLEPLKIGVVSDCADHLRRLAELISGAGFVVTVTWHAQSSTEDRVLEVDGWVVDLEMEEQYEQILEDLLEQTAVPVFFDEGGRTTDDDLAQGAWRRRLLEKLDGLAGTISLAMQAKNQVEEPEFIWVLAASLGGPEAVKEFIDHLPANLGASFIYAQHTQQDFDELLANVVTRDGHYPGHLSYHGDVLRRNQIAVIPVDRRVQVQNNGSISVSDEPWLGMYTPSIDAVIANVAKVYRERAGVIVFSGMGDDGANGCRIMKHCGGEVWAQESDSCVCDSMPHEAAATGTVTYKGDPATLARRLTYWLRSRQRNAPFHSLELNPQN